MHDRLATVNKKQVKFKFVEMYENRNRIWSKSFRTSNRYINYTNVIIFFQTTSF